MKKFISILIVSTIIFLVKGQTIISRNNQETKTPQTLTYLPLLNTTNLWSVLTINETTHIAPTDPFSWMNTNSYKLGKVVTIDTKNYYSLMVSYSENHIFWSLSTFIREEGQKIFLMNDQMDESLLYDFNLKIGETMSFKYRGKVDLVSKVDLIKDTVINNVTRKIFHLTTSLNGSSLWRRSERWIEGIGSSWGLTRDNSIGLTPGGVTWILTCFTENEKLTYQSKKYTKCYYNERYLGSPKLLSEAEILIFPNPCSGQFTISNNSDETHFDVEIISVDGQVIMQTDINFSHQINIDLSSRSKGIYCVRVRNEKESFTKKIILK
jgi:hypothetical protein